MTPVVGKHDTDLADLRYEVNELRDHYPSLSDDDSFCAWFVWAYLVDGIEEAVKSLTGAPNDKGIDAVWIDGEAQKAFVIQTKFRQRLLGPTEPRTDVLAFADLAGALLGDLEGFVPFLKGLDPLVAERARNVRDRCTEHGFGLELYYVTTGKFGSTVKSDAEAMIRHGSGGRAHLTLVDGRRVVRILDDYLDGVAPPVPSVDLPIEVSTDTGVVDHYDRQSGIESWVFTARGSDVGNLYTSSGPRIFARNIRGFLGSSAVNVAMSTTLANEPQHFLYFNNGVTIVCDDAEQHKSKGKSSLLISNPQIINGQQTTRVLAADTKGSTHASILVRVIRLPRAAGAVQDQAFENLVSQIVEATNWQNEIRASDLMSNDRRQIVIERGLRRLGYQYLRKRQTKGEARRSTGDRTAIVVKKHEFAQAAAACELDPALVREGREALFAERYYKRVFASDDPHYYLARYWLMRIVNRRAVGTQERTYSRWVVLNFIWGDVGTDLKHSAHYLEAVMERQAKFSAEVRQLERMVERVIRAAVRFYNLNAGTRLNRLDPNSFFKAHGRADQFQKFWHGSSNPHRRAYERARSEFLKSLQRVPL